MNYVGLDVHWRTSTMCILNHNGRKVKQETVRGGKGTRRKENGRTCLLPVAGCRTDGTAGDGTTIASGRRGQAARLTHAVRPQLSPTSLRASRNPDVHRDSLGDIRLSFAGDLPADLSGVALAKADRRGHQPVRRVSWLSRVILSHHRGLLKAEQGFLGSFR